MTSSSAISALVRKQAFSSPEKIVLREATSADNEALLTLTKLTPMAGKIALRIDREPDFFALLRARGTPIVYVAVYRGQVIGCMSAVTYPACISGAIEQVAHLGDLKVHPRFSGTRVALRLIAALDLHLRAEGIDLCLSLIADGNERALHFTDGKHGIPAALPAGLFIVDQIIPVPFRRTSKHYRIEEARSEDLPKIAELLDRTSRHRSFAPPVTFADLSTRTGSHLFRKMLVARDGDQIVATLTLEDTQDLRQNILIGVPPLLRVALAAFRCLTFVIPGFNVSRVGGPVRTLYVRFMACQEGREDTLKLLIAEARVQTFRQRFTFLSVGLHERDPLRRVVAGLPRLTFKSRALVSSLIVPERAKEIVHEMPCEDFALV